MSFAESDYPASWNSSTTTDEGYTLVRNIFVVVVYGSITLITIFGNILVIVAFTKDTHINRKVANWYILNLSVADLTVGLVSMTVNLIWLMTDDWPFGEVPCKIFLLVDYVVTNVPVCSIIFISLDRYWLLTKKLDYPKYQTKSKATSFIVFSWTFCIAFFGVMPFSWIPITGFEEQIDYSWNCELECTYNFEFQLFMIGFFFVFPLVTIACLNATVYRNIRERSKGFVRSKPIASSENKPQPISGANVSVNYEKSGDDSSNNGLGDGISNLSLISLRVQNLHSVGVSVKTSRKSDRSYVDRKQKEFNRHRKAAVTLAVLVGVFILCWLPFYVTSLLGTLCETCVPELTWEITSNLLWCNSTINPFLYAAMNRHFRDNFKKFLGLEGCLKNLDADHITSSTAS